MTCFRIGSALPIPSHGKKSVPEKTYILQTDRFPFSFQDFGTALLQRPDLGSIAIDVGLFKEQIKFAKLFVSFQIRFHFQSQLEF